MDRYTFGRELRRCREAVGLSQGQLATRLGYDGRGQFVSDTERGRSVPSIETAARFLAACGCRLTISTDPSAIDEARALAYGDAIVTPVPPGATP